MNNEAQKRNNMEILELDGEKQNRHKEEVKVCITHLNETFSTPCKSQKWSLQRKWNNSFEFIRNHFTRALKWHLKHLDTEILQDLKFVIAPVVPSIQYLKAELSN